MDVMARNGAVETLENGFRQALDLGSRAAAKKSGLVVCFGEMLIDFVPTVGAVSLAEAPGFQKAAGGAPANVAVGVARLGGKSAFVGKVGEDEFGRMLAGILRDNNVMDQGIRFDADARTALAFVTLKEDGEREFMFYRHPSADMLLKESELDKDLIRQASIFHYGSISLIAEPTRSTHLAAMRVAREGGALLSYDPNVRLPLWPSNDEARKGILSIWDKADLIKVSDEEVAFLTGGDPENDEVVMSLWHPRLKLLLVTHGKEGCRYYTKSFKGEVKSIAVRAIDTTGAGDAFVGGLLSQIVDDMSVLKDEQKLKEALRFANACGAITTTKKGAIPAMPDKSSVLQLLQTLQRNA
uniref:fructokinase n=1 Tax=Araucaria cunninghamii TaxID=56994 RepID=A0A0D6QSI0_ARACU